MARKYVSIDNFASNIFNYDSRSSKLSRHPSAKPDICPAGRVLTETGKQLLPGISPGILVRMVSIFDETTMIRGFINPSDGALFQPYNPALLEIVRHGVAENKMKAACAAELERNKEADKVIVLNELKRQSDEQLLFEKREKARLDEIKSQEIINMRKRQIDLAIEVEDARLKAEEDARQLKAENDARQLKAEEEAQLKAENDARQLKADEEVARIKAEEEARVKAEEEVARIKAEEEARVKAEEEVARIKAEEEVARIKAEEEARLKAEEEARLKAEEEVARIKAEEEARLKAEEEARLKAEEEARLKAMEEARLKAMEEARLKAMEEARIKAEEEARLKAEKEALLLQAEAEKKRPILSLNIDLSKETLNVYIEKHNNLVNKYTDILSGVITDNVIKTKVKGLTATCTPYAFEDCVINIIHYSNFKIVSSVAVESKVVQFLITNYSGGLITVKFDNSEMIIENEYIIDIPGKSERTCIISCYSDGKNLIEYARSKPLATPKNTKF
jgi:hypothetical protein